ncbi:Pentatricopeptide repeat-containing protein [Drosera capensis]
MLTTCQTFTNRVTKQFFVQCRSIVIDFRHRRPVPLRVNIAGFRPGCSFPANDRRYLIGVRVSWMMPLFGLLSKSIRSCKYLTSRSSCDEAEVTDELLDQVLAAADSSSHSNTEIFAFINKLCRTRNVEMISKLLELLHDKHILISGEAYDLLWAAASQAGDIKLMLTIFKKLLLSSISLGSSSYFTLARAWAKTSSNVLLSDFVREVSELTYPRSVVVLNRIIYAFAECGLTDKALAIYNQMRLLGCKPNLITYNTVLGILGRVGRIHDMLHEFSLMKEDDMVPDVVSYNTLINYLQKLGRLHQCTEYLREMREIGLQPDLRTYTSMIEGLGRSGDIKEALRLLNEMKHLQIRPSIYIYQSLVHNSKKMGKLEIAASLQKEMNSSVAQLIGPKEFKPRTR